MSESSAIGKFDQYRDIVRPEWIDYNEHLNMGYYMVVFDLATEAWFDFIGLDADYRRTQQVTTFSLEAHINYLREVRLGAPLRFTTQLLDYNNKCFHYLHEMYHAEDGYLAASNELVSLHVSQTTRRGAPIGDPVRKRLAAVKAAHDQLPYPEYAGRRIELKH